MISLTYTNRCAGNAKRKAALTRTNTHCKSKVNNLQRANKSDRGDSIQYERLAVMSRWLLPTAAKRHQPNHVKSAGNTEMSSVNSGVIC